MPRGVPNSGTRKRPSTAPSVPVDETESLAKATPPADVRALLDQADRDEFEAKQLEEEAAYWASLQDSDPETYLPSPSSEEPLKTMDLGEIEEGVDYESMLPEDYFQEEVGVGEVPNEKVDKGPPALNEEPVGVEDMAKLIADYLQGSYGPEQKLINTRTDRHLVYVRVNEGFPSEQTFTFFLRELTN